MWEFLTRTDTGGLTTAVGGGDAAVPRWLRLVRHGDDVEAFVSLQRGGDAFWTLVGQTSFAMPSTVYIGLAVTSHDPTVVNSATFQAVGVRTPTGDCPSPGRHRTSATPARQEAFTTRRKPARF